MGKISPFGILGETWSSTFQWIHLFLPIALLTAIASIAFNGYMTGMFVVDANAQTPAQLPENFWTIWALMMIGLTAVQIVQLSLFDAILERRQGWFAFGITRALRRLLPIIIGMILYMLLSVVGMLLLIIPGFIVILLLYMMLPLILLDGVNPFAAVKQSWQLTWGNAWRLVGAMIVIFLPLMLVLLPAGFALGFFSTETQLGQPLPSWSDWQTWAWAGLTAIIGAVATTFYLVTFKSLKGAKSGGGEAVAELVSA